MKIIAMIPARYAATRFPAKLMQSLAGKTVIRRTCEAVMATGLFQDVFVVTDSAIIFDEVVSFGGKAIMSQRAHESGSDRIAEAIESLDADVVINVQGDEPFIQPGPLKALVELFQDPSVQVGSLMRKIDDAEELSRSSAVKVVVSQRGDALYFSRSPIPFNATGHASGHATGDVAGNAVGDRPGNRVADLPGNVAHFLHIGVYGYRKETLLAFTRWAPGILERSEKLEQLRYLENGVSIRMALVDFRGIAIDTPEDFVRAQHFLKD